MYIERNAETRKSETVSRISESHLNASGNGGSQWWCIYKIYVVKTSRVPTRLPTANATERRCPPIENIFRR